MSLATLANPAEVYQAFFVPTLFTPLSRIFLRYAAPRPGERMLDLACGTGIVARQAAPLIGSEGTLTGVDISPAMLAVARQLEPPPGARIEWREGNALALDLPASSFDLVTCEHGLMFFPDQKAAGREMSRVLVPGGRAVVSTYQSIRLHPIYETLYQSLSRNFNIPFETLAVAFNLGDEGKLRELFMASGFECVEVAPETFTARFPEPNRFIQLTLQSVSAVVPAFRELHSGHDARMQAVHRDVDEVLKRHLEDGALAVPMSSYIVSAHKSRVPYRM